MNWKLWIAQGFGIGRIPVAPGTFGSILGLALFALLLWVHSFPAFCGTLVLGAACSVWLCGEAEKTLAEKDPGSVVLDEIIAIPVCFLVWLIWPGLGAPRFQSFFGGGQTIITIITFALFRLFDVWKPWPVKQSQRLPGGWGVTVDDLLAAVYVNIVWAAVLAITERFLPNNFLH